MDKKILESLKKFKDSLEELGIKIKKMIIFGSQAKGLAGEYSDIDVVVISDNFERMNILERLEIIGLASARSKIMDPIEALGYTEKEYASKRKGSFIYDEVKNKGIEIK